MEDYSKLDYEPIEGLAEELNSAADQMEYLLEEIKGKFNQIGTDDVWSGKSASEARSNFEQLSAKFPEFSQAVKDCSTHIKSSVENYKAADSAVMGEQ